MLLVSVLRESLDISLLYWKKTSRKWWLTLSAKSNESVKGEIYKNSCNVTFSPSHVIVTYLSH